MGLYCHRDDPHHDHRVGYWLCIPAAIAVWALVKPKVFVAYLVLGFVGALIAGVSWAAWV